MLARPGPLRHLGHPVGDQVIMTVVERIPEVVGEQNNVARLGGDEFAVIIRNAANYDVRRYID